jgi:hypothetical protein
MIEGSAFKIVYLPSSEPGVSTLRTVQVIKDEQEVSARMSCSRPHNGTQAGSVRLQPRRGILGIDALLGMAIDDSFLLSCVLRGRGRGEVRSTQGTLTRLVYTKHAEVGWKPLGRELQVLRNHMIGLTVDPCGDGKRAFWGRAWCGLRVVREDVCYREKISETSCWGSCVFKMRKAIIITIIISSLLFSSQTL